MNQIPHLQLLNEFTRWWKQNQRGGLSCNWRRRSVWSAQLIQKLGWHKEVTVPLFWGEKMRVITGETVSQGIISFGYGEPSITALMLRLLELGQTMVDVGTHFGYEALLGCRLVGSQGRVICFEPSPTTFAIAHKNLAHFSQIELRQEAVADQHGTLSLQNRPIWLSAFNSLVTTPTQINSINVPVTTLDLTLANRTRPVDLIKCDVEGLEMAVLKGANQLLSEDAPVLILEADMPSREGKNSSRTYEQAMYLERYGYKAFNFDFDGSFKFSSLDSFPVYHANLAFLPKARSYLLERLACPL
ncbi:MAG TPA: FkbM family methyltransferase [Leptolyngbyaceae cyanobacterium]